MRRLAALLLWVLLIPLAAQEPVFRIKVTMSGRRDAASFTSSLVIGYAPCAIWTGGSGGWVGSPAEYLQKSGGLAAIRPGMSLPFYAMTHEGHASGSDGSETSSASVVTTGPGRAWWTERDKYGQSEKHTDPGDRPDHRQSARFYRTEAGARIADFDLGVVSAGRGGGIGCVDPYAMEHLGPKVVAFCSFDITPEELANWKRLHKTKRETFSEDGATVTVTAELFAELEDPGEVVVEVKEYDRWIPEGSLKDAARPGNTLEVIAKVRATALEGVAADRTAEITFELERVSREKGVCLNWPVEGADTQPDLRLRTEENPELTPVEADRVLRSKGLVKEATLRVAAFDFAASGRLKVTAKGKDGKTLRVTYLGKPQAALTLPRDEDRNGIADAWQSAHGAEGLPATWDEAAVPGQDERGDGLSLIQKYRGLAVLQGTAPDHVRLKPHEKVHFVIDPAGLFDIGRWKRMTGSVAYRLPEGWTQDRRINVHAPDSAPGKYASRIRRDPEPLEEAAVKREDVPKNLTRAQYLANLRAQWAYSVGIDGVSHWKPSHVEAHVICSGRIHTSLMRIRDAMLKDLEGAAIPTDADYLAFMRALGLSEEELRRRLKALTDQALWTKVPAIEQWLALHEVAHGCGVNGHVVKGEESENCVPRVLDCPMQYATWMEKRLYLLFGSLGGGGSLCREAAHDCWKRFSPKG